MKVIELNGNSVTLKDLVDAAQQEDIALFRDGRPLARLERLDEEDWEDWQYESSPAAIERGRQAREQFARGEFKSIEEVKKDYEKRDQISQAE